MHTTVIKETRFHHNSDFSGDIIITRSGEESIEVPFEDLVEIVAKMEYNKEIERLENLGLRIKP